MFETITKSLQSTFDKLGRRGRLTEKNIRDGMREVRTALLSADVHFDVVKEFTRKVTDRAIGENVIKTVAPSEQIVKIVHDELESLMGPTDTSIRENTSGPTVIMMVGLQGSGKTTTCGKLAHYLVRKGHHPLLVAADVKRPGAIDQLEIVGESVGVDVFTIRGGSPTAICRKSIRHATQNEKDIVILDTAGRLHIDETLMVELVEIQRSTKPQEIFLVCDAMTGQDAVKSAKEFDQRLAVDGVILTKMDGDARGGAALSIRAITGKPIKFVGTGEKMDRLEEFHPDRMAGRILGMGDIVSLVERAQEVVDLEKAEDLQEKILSNQFTLDDFYEQLQQVKKIGGLQEVMAMMPGDLGGNLPTDQIDESELGRVEAIILSMTYEERIQPDLIGPSRRNRIARGSGTSPANVNALLKQFREMRKMMKQIGKMGALMGKIPGVPGMKMGTSGKKFAQKRKIRRSRGKR